MEGSKNFGKWKKQSELTRAGKGDKNYMLDAQERPDRLSRATVSAWEQAGMFGMNALNRVESGHEGCSISTRNCLASTRDGLDRAEPRCGRCKGFVF